MFGVQTSSGNLHEMAIASSSQAGRVLAQPLSHRQNLDMHTLNTLVKSQRTSKLSPLGKWLPIIIYIKFTDKWQCCVGTFSHFDLFSGHSFTVTKLMWKAAACLANIFFPDCYCSPKFAWRSLHSCGYWQAGL